MLQGQAVAMLVSAISQGDRNQAMDGFRAGKVTVLVTTDVVGRGLDVSVWRATLTFMVHHQHGP